MPETVETRPPERLRSLVSWQASRVNTIGARLTAARMPLHARADFAVLATLEEQGQLSQADLGRSLGLDRNTVNEIVGRLEAGGLVDRAADPADRRRNTLALTPSGRRHLEELQAVTDEVQGELTASLTAPEVRQLKALLAKLLGAHPSLPS